MRHGRPFELNADLLVLRSVPNAPVEPRARAPQFAVGPPRAYSSRLLGLLAGVVAIVFSKVLLQIDLVPWKLIHSLDEANDEVHQRVFLKQDRFGCVRTPDDQTLVQRTRGVGT